MHCQWHLEQMFNVFMLTHCVPCPVQQAGGQHGAPVIWGKFVVLILLMSLALSQSALPAQTLPGTTALILWPPPSILTTSAPAALSCQAGNATNAHRWRAA